MRANGSPDWLIAQAATASSLEFIENVKIDLFPDEVYLFTPRGDILSLPRNATALDFAYAVHTDVGDHAVAARVDKRLRAPAHAAVLRSGRRDRHGPLGAAQSRSGWNSWSVARRAPPSATT